MSDSAEVLAITLDAIYSCATDADRWEDLLESFPELDAEIRKRPASRLEDAIKPHFQRAEDLARRLASSDTVEARDTSPVAYLIMGRDQKLLESSPSAAEMLAPYCGALETGQRVTMLDPENLARYRAARQALREGAGSVPLLLHHEDEKATQSLSGFLLDADQLSRLFVNEKGASDWSEATALILPDRTALVRHDHVLRESLGLTPAELRLATLLKDGISINDAAGRLGIAVNTARNQLRAIFAKLGVNRQSEMVRHLAELGQLAAYVQSNKKPVAVEHVGQIENCDGARRFVELPDGRILSYREYGRPGGTPVLFLHSVLSNSMLLPQEDEEARRLDVRLIVVERPGTGRSTPHKEMTFDSVGADLVNLVDALKIDDIYISGRSSGAPFALAAARQLGRRVPRIMLWAARFAADKDRSRRDILGRFYTSMLRAPWYADAALALLRAKASRPFIREMVARSYERSPRDHAMLYDVPMLEFVVDQTLEALEQTHAGVTDEAKLLHNDQPIDLDGLTAELIVWHGSEDGFVPVDEVERRFSNLPLSEFRIVPNEGHVFSMPRRAEALERLIS